MMDGLSDLFHMIHLILHAQMSCDLNPQPVSSGSGFDYNSIKASVTQNLVESSMKATAPSSVVPSSVVPEKRGGADADDERTEQILNNTRRLSRWSPPCPVKSAKPRIVSGRSRFDA